MARTHIAVGELQGFEDASDAQKVLNFFTLQANSCQSYRQELNLEAGATQCAKQIAARSAYEVWMSADSGDAESCLELGLRMYSGCGANQDRDGALDWWSRISDPSHPNFIRAVSRPLKAKALSCLASVFFERSDLHDDTLQVDDLYRAAYFANESASLGFISPSVLAIGAKIEKIGLRRQADCRYPGVDTTRFGALEFLWRAADARTEEMNRKRQKRDTKVSQTPNLYVCAAEGCGIEGTSRSGLLRCAGKCASDVKPSYCSKECQKADWPRHKGTCKGEAKLEDNSQNVTLPPRKTDDTIRGNMRNDGRELNIDVPLVGIPGGKVQISSTTMSASWMKEFRDRAVEEAARR